MKKTTIYSLLILGMLLSCAARTRQRKLQIVQPSYSATDTIYVSDMILCDGYRHDRPSRNNIRPVVDKDSIATGFLHALNKMDLPLVISNNVALYCDSALQKNFMVYLDRIDHNTILNLAQKNGNATVMVPMVYIDIADNRFFGLSASLIPDGGASRGFFIEILITIVKDGKIIYHRLYGFGVEAYEGKIESEYSYLNITEKQWDKWVRKAMSDYTKRMK